MRGATYGRLNGVARFLGVRPGDAFAYDGPIQQDVTSYTLTYATTREAIAQYLPPPLEPDLDAPPVVAVTAFHVPCWRNYDGRGFGYTGVRLEALARFGEHRGRVVLVEYVDGLGGDKTPIADRLIGWGLFTGVPRKLGDIDFLPSGEGMLVTLARRGTRLLTMGITRSEGVEAAEALPFGPGTGLTTLAVRDVPANNMKGYLDHSVVRFGAGLSHAPRRAWRADGWVELGGLELDPLELLEVVEVTGGAVTLGDVPQEMWSGAELVERLPHA